MPTSNDLTEHFSWNEFACRCGCEMSPFVSAKVAALADVLEVVRAEIGGPITIKSGHRCFARNQAVGGARRSRHLHGDACDISVAGKTGLELREIFERLIDSGDIPDGGLGTYPDRPKILHYDLRGSRVRW